MQGRGHKGEERRRSTLRHIKKRVRLIASILCPSFHYNHYKLGSWVHSLLLVQLLRAFLVVCIYCLSTFSLFLSTFSPNFFARKCLAAEETVAAAVAASAATAVEACNMYPDMSYSETTTTETLIVGVAPQNTNTLRDLRWVWELRMAANVEPTAAVTLAPANEQMTTS
ncbi:unnamed protein product [Camellia sinensis]